MHAYERTMLAKLGFADPDRCEQLHELACQYLATPAATRRLLQYLAIERGPEPYETNSGNEEQVSRAVWRPPPTRSLAPILSPCRTKVFGTFTWERISEPSLLTRQLPVLGTTWRSDYETSVVATIGPHWPARTPLASLAKWHARSRHGATQRPT